MMLDPTHAVESRRTMLFLTPLNRERERWDGLRMEISESLREKTGFKAIFRTDLLGRMLKAAAGRAKKLACLHPLAQHDQPVSPDLTVLGLLAERIPGVTIEDRSDLVGTMRTVKSQAETALIQQAIDITRTGFEAMMRAVRPGLNEFEVQEIIEHAYRSNGARSTAFPTIVGSGINSTVLHYRANDQVLQDGDLICVDSGARFGGYAADITRTVPVTGKFSPRQREIYETVLTAELVAIKAVKPGVTLAKIDELARAVIKKAGFGDYFIHSIGHHLGLETHDVTPEDPLKPGAVITIEPGIYIPQDKIGVRIEDDIRVTKEGGQNLSAKIPKTVTEIEREMGRA